MVGVQNGSKSALTNRQKEIYEFLRDKIRNRGYGPTVREIGDHMGWSSSSTTHYHLAALVREGLLKRHDASERRVLYRRAGDAEVLGYVIVEFAPEGEPKIDTYSGYGGDVYVLREEGEEILALTRATYSLHRPTMRYDLAEVRKIEVAQETLDQRIAQAEAREDVVA